jgi:hypothetical protein
MKRVMCVLAAIAFLSCVSGYAQVKPCEELKSEIDAKLKEKGVTNYSLEIVPADQAKDQKVVGSCDGGKSKITYTKESKEVKEPKEVKNTKDKK